MAGKLATREVFNRKSKMIVFNRIQSVVATPLMHGGVIWGNAPMPRFLWNSISECVPALGYTSLTDAKQDIGQYLMGYYNWQRPHQYNGGPTPA